MQIICTQRAREAQTEMTQVFNPHITVLPASANDRHPPTNLSPPTYTENLSLLQPTPGQFYPTKPTHPKNTQSKKCV